MADCISNGTRIRYDDVGVGEPAILLMPGWCANRTVFQELTPLLSVHRRTLALDWRGHGESGSPTGSFGADGLLEDALAVIDASGAHAVVPVAHSHAGWVAIQLRRKLGDRIPKLVLLDWLVTGAPEPFRDVLRNLQSPELWRPSVAQLCAAWMQGVDIPALTRSLRESRDGYGFEMWARAAREIGAAYAHEGRPLQCLATLAPPLPVLHLCSQSADSSALEAQEFFANRNPWFNVRTLRANSHFPMFEAPDEMALAIDGFVRGNRVLEELIAL